MADSFRENKGANGAAQDFVVVAFVSDIDQAKAYSELLEKNDIPAAVKEGNSETAGVEIAVTVPEEYLDEAHVLIESQETYDNFYDFTCHEISDDDYFGNLDDNLLDDEGF